ncbi:MAG TPA: hypothetical protein VGN34_14340 [Ktedonobacteraceae bacterium]|jgi:hypothetical protein
MMDDDPLAELKADIEADRLRRSERKARQATRMKAWRASLSPERRKQMSAQTYAQVKEKGTHIEVKRAKIRRLKERLVEHMGGKCNDCGGIFHPAVFEFHHIDNKNHNIPRLYHHRWESIIKELEHCVMLCANCHRMRHVKGTD